jgi:ABC-type transport system substrate-binding protein
MVREAVTLGLNRSEIVKALGAGMATPLPFAPGSPFYNVKTAHAASYNLKKAKALLRGLGPFPKSTMIFSSDPQDQEVATVIQSQLQALGLPVTLLVSANAATDLIRLKPLFLVSTSLDKVANYITLGGPANPCLYDDPVATAAWNQGLLNGALSISAQAKQLNKAQQIWTTQGGALAWIASVPLYVGYSDSLKGVTQLMAESQNGLELRTLYKTK